MHHLFLWRGISLSKNISVLWTTYGTIHTWDPILRHHWFSCFHWLLSNTGIPRRGVQYSSPRMDDLESVVANVVERSSWEKSRRGRKCRFPPKGGLHHTSGDASLETHLEIPNWCHVYKSQSPSSRRTRAAQRSTGLCHRHIGGIQQSTGDASMRFAKGSNRAIIYVRLSPEKLHPWIYNAYRQNLSRTILLSVMGVMITRVYCLHPWTQHGIVFEYAMVIFGWLCHRPWYRRERHPDYGASS
jgi:hypothetical protein